MTMFFVAGQKDKGGVRCLMVLGSDISTAVDRDLVFGGDIIVPALSIRPYQLIVQLLMCVFAR